MRQQVQRLIAAASFALIATCSMAQQAAPSLEERLSDPVYMSWVSHQDVASCVRCHLAGPNVGEIIGDAEAGLTPFSRRQELEHWLNLDKHTIARRRVEPFAESRTKQELTRLIERLDEMARAAADRLQSQGIRVDASQIGLTEFPEEWIGESNFLSRRICDKLWGQGSVETEEGYAKFRDNCLTCHGGYQPGAPGFELNVTEQAKIGIGCLYCHQDGENDAWVADHAAPNPEQNWRLLPPGEKAAAGMRDLVNVANQADLCMDCHVGNRSKNMFVSHEMYAAGHPPIPSIELHTFCTEMPQHWQTPSQLHQALEQSGTRDQYFAVNYPGVVDSVDAGKTFWNTRKMMIGALSARKKTLDLIAESASAHQWGDYSLYDCASCHHELQSNSFRQQRGFPAAPGRPRQHEWPQALLDLAYQFAGDADAEKAQQLELELESAFGTQPFGDVEAVGQAATQLRNHLADAIAKTQSKTVDGGVAMTVLMKLTQTPVEHLVTYDAARQVVWAMQTVAAEMESENVQLDSDVRTQIQKLGAGDEAGIATKLPSGRKQFIYAKALQQDLEQRAAFDPEALKRQLIEIGKLMGVTQSANLRFE